jgi:oligopeptide/dipeptide ABC transporter ATP-binding protein
LSVTDLRVGFPGGQGVIPIVRGISYTIDRGKTLGVVGESGCGKSMTALSIMGLLPADAVLSGRIALKGLNLVGLAEPDYRQVRGARAAMIFQEPMTALNPVLSIGEQIAEVLRLHKGLSARLAFERAVAILDEVHIPSASKRARDYPHQLSGGMRQRAMIAMALAGEPELLIADEPTTALDVTIQAQIVDLMLELQERVGMAIQFISHNLALISELADNVVVMYAGAIVESAPAARVFSAPRHPYTIGLMRTLPDLAHRVDRLEIVPGMVPDPRAAMTGCRFHPRCPLADDQCKIAEPPFVTDDSGHGVACFKAGGL